MNLHFALKILRLPEKQRLEKHSPEEITEANRTVEIMNSMRICPMCNSRIVYYNQYQLGGCFPCLSGASKERIREVRSEIHFETFQKYQDILKKKLEEDGCKNIPDYICPSCNKELIVRVSSINAEKFWGCSTFPSCKYTDTFYGEKFPAFA